MTEEKANEMVLCLSREAIEQHRVSVDTPLAIGAWMAYEDAQCRELIRRGDAEESLTHIQVIPYCVVTREDKILMYTRSKTGGDSRLHDKCSIGVGGHINQQDVNENAQMPHLVCILRELQEEIEFDVEGMRQVHLHNAGWFYDDSNDVSKVHVCNLHILPIPEDIEVEPNEDTIKDLTWLTIEELRSDDVWPKLESWSQKAVECIEAIHNLKQDDEEEPSE